MENICGKRLTVHTELCLPAANQESYTINKFGPVPSQTTFQSLFLFLITVVV